MTKIKLNLYDMLTQAFGGEIIHLPVAIDLSELLELDSIDDYQQDIDDLLHDNRLVAHLWSVEDVRSVRPDLNDDQAWTVLQRIKQHLDSSVGITWESIEQTARELFGLGSIHRIERCDKAIVGYSDDLPDSNLIDFMADAMHWCKAKGYDFDAKLEMARTHFGAETTSE